MNDVSEHILDNASDALLNLVNTAELVCKEFEEETGHPPMPTMSTAEAITRLRLANKVVVAAFGLIPTDDGAVEASDDTNARLRN